MPDPAVNQDPSAPTPGSVTPAPAVGDPTPATPTPPVEAAKPVIPEKYEFKLPDGVEVDAKAVEAFTPVLKELGLTQEAAQRLAELHVKELERQDQALNEMYVAQAESWATASKTDKEFGGANFDANLQIATKAVGRFATPELKEILRTTGLGNHPEFVRMFWKLGKAISEDSHVQGGNSTTTPQPVESLLFDHPTSKMQ